MNFTHLDVLKFCLRSARPHGSKAITETMDMLSKLAQEHNPGADIHTDRANNLWIDLRGGDQPATLFMAHLDTVEYEEGVKEVFMDDGGIIHTNGKAVLGADDGAGIGILAALMEAHVPALYLFTQAEESGGQGGKFAAERLAYDMFRCIAFDRKGTTEICGAQWCGALASEQFVRALSEGLGLGHVWGEGTYTDNSEFQDLIPEIVNISVGYEHNHGPRETLDFHYWQKLRDAAIALDWDSLPTVGATTDPVMADFLNYWS